MISVVMSAYNASEFIAEAIESVLNQTFQQLELIVVDDGSTDNTVEIIRCYLELDQRVKLIQNTHVGICHARNTGIQASKYPWIAILDADDIALKDRFETQIKAASSNPKVVVWGSYIQHINTKGEILTLQKQGPTSEEEYHNLIKSKELPFVVHSTVMLKKEILLQAGLYDLKFPLAQDLELISRMALYGPILAIPKPLVLYRVHSQSASMQKFFTQQLYARWIIARHQARLVDTKIPEYEDFIAQESQKSLLLRWSQDLRLAGQFWYRKAGLSIADQQYLQGSVYLTMAIALHPSYSVPRVWKQRFSKEARQSLKKL
jgi:glycosyltransferase involved in cell wall biosynthesis